MYNSGASINVFNGHIITQDAADNAWIKRCWHFDGGGAIEFWFVFNKSDPTFSKCFEEVQHSRLQLDVFSRSFRSLHFVHQFDFWAKNYYLEHRLCCSTRHPRVHRQNVEFPEIPVANVRINMLLLPRFCNITIELIISLFRFLLYWHSTRI